MTVNDPTPSPIIAVIGSGAFGTTIAQAITRAGHDVTLLTRSDAVAEEINTVHTHHRALEGITLNTRIQATTDTATALRASTLYIVVPAQALRETLDTLKPQISSCHTLVLCCKGVELTSGKLMSEVVTEIVPQASVAVLSGPNFAREIAAGKPAAATLACADHDLAQRVQATIASPTFRPYMTDDIIGAQLAGALKNVIAIACGMAEGLNLGESARASIVTRGLAEISALGAVMGAQAQTFLGLCGVGDMMLTCSSRQSRNFSVGLALGQGKSMADIRRTMPSLAEGVHTARAAHDLAVAHNVDMPLCSFVHKCLNEGLSLDVALHDVLNRSIGDEFKR